MKRISMTYGQVLFELGIKKESLQKAQDMLHENEELLSALENPTITKKEKENVVEKLFSDDIKSFLKVVCDNDDIACFDEAVEYYDELKRKTDKIIKAEFDYVTMPKDEQLVRLILFHKILFDSLKLFVFWHCHIVKLCLNDLICLAF